MVGQRSVKILFSFYSDILDQDTVEIVLAEIVDPEKGYYKIIKTPFYVPKLAADDMVWAEYNDKEEAILYRKTIQHSGNSTVHAVVLDDKYDIKAITGIFADLGCNTEKLNHRYFAINIPPYLDYSYAKFELDELANEKIIDYAESGLSEKHQYRNYYQA